MGMDNTRRSLSLDTISVLFIAIFNIVLDLQKMSNTDYLPESNSLCFNENFYVLIRGNNYLLSPQKHKKPQKHRISAVFNILYILIISLRTVVLYELT